MGSIANQKDQLWQVDGLGFPADYFFFGKSGGKVSQEHAKDYDGGMVLPEISVTDAPTDDITLTGKYRPADHRSIMLALKARLKAKEYIPVTLKGFDCDAQKTPIGQVETIQAVLKEVDPSEHASDSTTKSTWMLVFSVP